MHRLFAILLLAAIPLTAQDLFKQQPAVSLGQNPAEVEFLPVEEAYQLALEIVDEQHIRLYWEIADGYYMYRKRFGFKLEQAETEVAITPQLPRGIEHEDEYFGRTEVYYHYADVTLAVARSPGPATLTVTSQGCADAGLCYPPQKQRFEVDLTLGLIAAISSKPPASASGNTASTSTNSSASLAKPASDSRIMTLLSMLLLAFIGGSILNLMPCVFPVLSLKVYSFAAGDAHTRHVHGWIYAAGVVSSFLLVAAVLIALQQAGTAVGWGFQLQSPRFVSVLAYLFLAMGLSLSGLLEIGAGWMGTGSSLANREGHAGAFFTGVLAAVVASPCTAPFMGTALGFAVTQPPAIALLIFAALGAGMAAPMLLLSYSRHLREIMPRPGPWMETFKQLLAFPLYATAIWLLWVAGRQTSTNTMAVLLCGMLAMALGMWLWRYRNWTRLIAAACAVAALAVITNPMLAAREAAQTNSTAGSEAFSEQQLAALLEEGKPVFVNVTADWCITCIVNEQAALSTAAFKQAMSAANVSYLKADWTNYNPESAAFLKQFNRNGIPLYLVYSGRAGEAPQVLPQLLTAQIVLDALERI
ncbi:MAG: protein-disulfide reductase DsbD [Gammaproteobacteria bacterium]|nr:protein-disulfide reductase DsbD [Gammaproteobacteria bacterium]